MIVMSIHAIAPQLPPNGAIIAPIMVKLNYGTVRVNTTLKKASAQMTLQSFCDEKRVY
jgi:hypothetical protein